MSSFHLSFFSCVALPPLPLSLSLSLSFPPSSGFLIAVPSSTSISFVYVSIYSLPRPTLLSPLLFSLLPSSHSFPLPPSLSLSLCLSWLHCGAPMENSARLQLACAPAIKSDKPLIIRPFRQTVFYVEITFPPLLILSGFFSLCSPYFTDCSFLSVALFHLRQISVLLTTSLFLLLFSLDLFFFWCWLDQLHNTRGAR